MPFFLRKLAEALLVPVGFSGLLVILGVLIRRRSIAIAGVVTLYAFGTPIVARLMLQPLERAYAPMTVAAASTADAIVVLSGGIVRGVSAPGVQWGESSNRYFAGFDLAMADKAKLIVLSAGPPENPPGLSQGALLRQVALQHGIAPDRIIVTPFVWTTEDEARAVSAIPGIHSVLLVTSAFHMPRSVLLFRARGLNVTPFPTDERVLGKWILKPISLIPVSAHLEDSEKALREYYGLAVYRTILFFRPAAL